MTFKIGIPVRPWVKKFVHYVEETAHDKTIPISQSGIFPYQALLLMEKKTNAAVDGDEKISESYSEILMFEGRMSLLDKGYVTFRNIHVIAFNRLVQRMLYELIMERLRTYRLVEIKRDLKTVIYEFIDLLDCADEMDYHTIAKGIQRHKKSKLLRYDPTDKQMDMFGKHPDFSYS